MHRISLLFILATFVSPLHAADQVLELGGATLGLGMPEKAVLVKLDAYFRVTCEEDQVNNSCIVWNKDGPPFSPKANVVFERGNLTHARKYWTEGYEGKDPSKLVETLFDAVSRIAGEGATTVTLRLSERREPGTVSKAIFLTNGRKTVSITVAEGLKSGGKSIPTFTNIDEVLE